MRLHLYIVSMLAFLSPLAVSAATISFRATPTAPGVGDTVRVDVLVDSALPINAFSGNLHYSTALEPVAVSDGNSLVSMWITHPTVVDPTAPIAFAGITPGGFSGDRGLLFSILFRAKAVGRAALSFDMLQVLRNDGVGGSESTSVEPLALTVGNKSSGGYVEPRDEASPESFTAVLGTDASVAGGKAYLVFSTLDKGSGVDHYAVAESRLPAFLFTLFPLVWHTTASPYTLADQDRTSTVYVKAVDRSHNERLSIYPPQHLFTPYEKAALLAILILVVFLWQKGTWRRRLGNKS